MFSKYESPKPNDIVEPKYFKGEDSVIVTLEKNMILVKTGWRGGGYGRGGGGGGGQKERGGGEKNSLDYFSNTTINSPKLNTG